MSRGELVVQLFDHDGPMQALVMRGGVKSWSVACLGDDDCFATILGYETRARAIHGAEWHLRWHDNGKPTCDDCGQWLSRKGSKRCHKGTCEVTQ